MRLPRINHLVSAAAAVAATGLLLLGCVKREETITIEPDGSVFMQVRYEADSDEEIHLGDAPPAITGGWLVSESVTHDQDGDDVYVLEAQAGFSPKDDLPSSFEAPRAVNRGTSLNFPTTVTIEERSDGTYYHFHRHYTARPWAHLDASRELLKEQAGGFEGLDFATMTDGQREGLISVLARSEALKYQVFARAAFRDALPDGPQDAWLKAATAITATTEALDYSAILSVMVDENGEIDEEALEREGKAFEESIIQAMRQALLDHGEVSSSSVNEFIYRFNWHKRYHEITEDLADEGIALTVVMPGEIVAHNAKSVAGNKAMFEIAGEDMRDKEIELMVTSRLNH
ncbi:MAG: hypothetical protein JSV91_00720 [Phycisphaerales bacterium]|nr:MAG: hypothetical protein JSV91_00720 [Phycisphaerales bacterium]